MFTQIINSLNVPSLESISISKVEEAVGHRVVMVSVHPDVALLIQRTFILGPSIVLLLIDEVYHTHRLPFSASARRSRRHETLRVSFGITINACT